MSIKCITTESIVVSTADAGPKPGAPAMGKCAGQVVLFVFEYLFGVD